jgi:hypothetical protein
MTFIFTKEQEGHSNVHKEKMKRSTVIPDYYHILNKAAHNGMTTDIMDSVRIGRKKIFKYLGKI